MKEVIKNYLGDQGLLENKNKTTQQQEQKTSGSDRCYLSRPSLPFVTIHETSVIDEFKVT